MRVRPLPSATTPSSSILTWSILSSSLMYSWTYRCLQVSTTTPSFTAPSPLPVHRSKLHIRPSPLPVHRHGTSLLDLHLTVDHLLRAPTCAPQAKKHVTQPQLTPWLVHWLNSRHKSRWQSLITTKPQGHILTLCSQRRTLNKINYKDSRYFLRAVNTYGLAIFQPRS
jgi:hypothetical protein